jgi:aspartate 1-decarboxylase
LSRIFLKSKIHRAVIQETNLHYEGSITLDPVLMKAAHILPYEQVHVLNLNNGFRLETYAIEGEQDKGMVCLNGAAARNAIVGDKIIILTYQILDEPFLNHDNPIVVFVDSKNKILEVKEGN